MKWEQHRRICLKAAELAGFQQISKELAESCILPDKYPEKVPRVGRRGRVYYVPVRHHGAPTRLIMHHIWKSRKAWLDGIPRLAAKHLGYALHYIQDSCISKASRLWILSYESEWAHELREAQAAESELPLDSIRAGIQDSRTSFQLVRNAVRSLRPLEDPIQILDQACYNTGLILKAVLGDRDPPRDLLVNFESRLNTHLRKHYLAGWIAFSLLAGISGFHPGGLILGALIGYLITKSDREYHRLAAEAKWFGISRSRPKLLASLIARGLAKPIPKLGRWVVKGG